MQAASGADDHVVVAFDSERTSDAAMPLNVRGCLKRVFPSLLETPVGLRFGELI